MCPGPPSDLGDGRDGALSEPHEYHLVLGVQSGLPGQAESPVQLAAQAGVTYKTAWYMLKRIRMARGQRDAKYRLNGVIEFDDVYFESPTTGKKRGRSTE